MRVAGRAEGATYGLLTRRGELAIIGALHEEEQVMKDGIHPKYYPNCKVYHNGQVVMTVGATVPEMYVEVWSGSHPFFTGKQTFVDAAGRVEKFQRKYAGNYFAKK